MLSGLTYNKVLKPCDHGLARDLFVYLSKMRPVLQLLQLYQSVWHLHDWMYEEVKGQCELSVLLRPLCCGLWQPQFSTVFPELFIFSSQPSCQEIKGIGKNDC